jgi:hypothetical protein
MLRRSSAEKCFIRNLAPTLRGTTAKGMDEYRAICFRESLVRLFNGRVDIWSDRARIEGARIIALSAEGRVTAELLESNSESRIGSWRLISSLQT